ncbi:Transposase domain [Daejeonella rubra]|uniref:Transposase domain n=1 Tax=Daejeonella rubra TaxID=990371 RepID=A0A1G9XJF6_9SPHI|nr:Transposase domain [Daejeonella rubra]
MSLLQTWYGLSDYEVEEKVNDSLSFMKFVGLTLEDNVPDNTVLSRFRSELTFKQGYEKLMDMINGQLEEKGNNSSASNRKYLKSKGLKDGIMHKAVKNKPLSNHQVRFNKIVSQIRFRVERTFGGIS